MLMLASSEGQGTGTAGASAAATIRTFNDALRRNPGRGSVMLSVGVRLLADDQLRQLFNAVRAFDAFDAGNDPYDEHDFGAVDFEGITYFWKIDYYDLDRRHGSPDPSDPDVTRRVLTIMLADEY